MTKYQLMLRRSLLLVQVKPTVIASGDCGTNAHWELKSNGNLSIWGSGSIDSYSTPSDQPWAQYRNKIRSIEIDTGIETIGTRAFSNFGNTQIVVLPSGLLSINDYAFIYNYQLAQINFPSSLIYIGNYVFQNSNMPEDISLPNKVEYLGNNPFYRCSNLKSLSVENDGLFCSSYDDGIYYGSILICCAPQKRGSFTLKQGSTVANPYSCAYCSGIDSVYIPFSVEQLKRNAFLQSDNITDVYYQGNETQWSNVVSNSADGNNSLFSATIHYNWTPQTA